MWLSLALLGVLAGALTTVAGMGGGVLLVIAVSLLIDPLTAMAITTPALMLGNLHRLALFFGSVDRVIVRRFVAGALPGSIVGGALTSQIPNGWMSALLLGTAALGAARSLGWVSFRPPRRALTPVGLVIGAMSATAGAGLLVGPVLMSAGLTGSAFIATGSACAVAMHAGRVMAYVGTGLLGAQLLPMAATIAVSIFAGNALGRRARQAISSRTATRLEVASLAVCVILAVAAVGK